MATCATCARVLTLPPTIDYLLTTYPTITPLYAINQQIPRCKHCDHISAYKKIIDAEFPPPHYKNPVREIEEHIRLAQELIADGVQVQRLQGLLQRMWEMLAEKINERNEGTKRACEWFWGIWAKIELESFAS
jgi:hypothetical protein